MQLQNVLAAAINCLVWIAWGALWHYLTSHHSAHIHPVMIRPWLCHLFKEGLCTFITTAVQVTQIHHNASTLHVNITFLTLFRNTRFLRVCWCFACITQNASQPFHSDIHFCHASFGYGMKPLASNGDEERATVVAKFTSNSTPPLFPFNFLICSLQRQLTLTHVAWVTWGVMNIFMQLPLDTTNDFIQMLFKTCKQTLMYIISEFSFYHSRSTLWVNAH